jgi:hypothetical protein
MARETTPVSGNRFINSDLSELQEVNRNPIFGYQRRPVMSLEEAVEGIVPFVPHVKTYADEAKQHCRQNTQLTINESAAIYLYTMPKPFYENFNKALRAENPLALEPWFAFLKLLINALTVATEYSMAWCWNRYMLRFR